MASHWGSIPTASPTPAPDSRPRREGSCHFAKVSGFGQDGMSLSMMKGT